MVAKSPEIGCKLWLLGLRLFSFELEFKRSIPEIELVYVSVFKKESVNKNLSKNMF